MNASSQVDLDNCPVCTPYRDVPGDRRVQCVICLRVYYVAQQPLPRIPWRGKPELVAKPPRMTQRGKRLKATLSLPFEDDGYDA